MSACLSTFCFKSVTVSGDFCIADGVKLVFVPGGPSLFENGAFRAIVADGFTGSVKRILDADLFCVLDELNNIGVVLTLLSLIVTFLL